MDEALYEYNTKGKNLFRKFILLLVVLVLLHYYNVYNIYIITQVIHGFWLVLAYDLLEDRRTIDVTISFYANNV